MYSFTSSTVHATIPPKDTTHYIATHIFTDWPEYDILGQLHVNRMARYHVVNRGCMYTTRQTNSYVFRVVNTHQHLSSNYIKTHSQDDHHE